jgi:hypothetical protein
MRSGDSVIMGYMEPGSGDRFAEWFVDMIQASEEMSDAEGEAEADPAMVERLDRITDAMFREKKPPTNGERQSVCSTCTANHWF